MENTTTKTISTAAFNKYYTREDALNGFLPPCDDAIALINRNFDLLCAWRLFSHVLPKSLKYDFYDTHYDYIITYYALNHKKENKLFENAKDYAMHEHSIEELINNDPHIKNLAVYYANTIMKAAEQINKFPINHSDKNTTTKKPAEFSRYYTDNDFEHNEIPLTETGIKYVDDLYAYLDAWKAFAFVSSAAYKHALYGFESDSDELINQSDCRIIDEYLTGKFDYTLFDNIKTAVRDESGMHDTWLLDIVHLLNTEYLERANMYANTISNAVKIITNETT